MVELILMSLMSSKYLFALTFIPNPKIIEDALEIVLSGKTGVAQITGNSRPFVKTAIVEPT